MAVVKGGVSPAFGLTQTPATGFLSGTQLAINLNLSVSLGNGTAADQIDLVAVKTFTFVASTLQAISLQAMVDVLGNAVSFARVNLFALRVEGQTDAASLTVTPSASNGWSTGWLAASSTVTLGMSTATNTNGGFLLLSAPNTTGWAVDGTHKSLDLTPSAHAFTATLVVAGRSV